MPQTTPDNPLSRLASGPRSSATPRAVPLAIYDMPRWVTEPLTRARSGATRQAPLDHAPGQAAQVTISTGPEMTLVSAVLPRADRLDGAGLRAAAGAMYGWIRTELAGSGATHPVRVWNYIPGITRPSGSGLNRYMSFNLGRFDSLCAWLGDGVGDAAADDAFLVRLLPAATGVGHGGDELAVHVLACRDSGRPVENPRQRPAYRYSTRFGPRPPCFARAAVVRTGGRARLLISGTASVRGEESVHAGSLREQTEETFANLGAVVLAAQGCAGRPEADPLRRIVEARAYCPDPASASDVLDAMRERLVNAPRPEAVHADLCRPELLVEIEAVADLGPDSTQLEPAQ